MMSTHGRSTSSTYTSWQSMKRRCNTPLEPAYPKYGGAGIKHCESWGSFENFLADMGERPSGTSLDRIDNAKGYSKDNCRWATRQEQNENRSHVRRFEHDGESLTLAEIARRERVSQNALRYRVNTGLGLNEALAGARQSRVKPPQRASLP